MDSCLSFPGCISYLCCPGFASFHILYRRSVYGDFPLDLTFHKKHFWHLKVYPVECLCNADTSVLGLCLSFIAISASNLGILDSLSNCFLVCFAKNWSLPSRMRGINKVGALFFCLLFTHPFTHSINHPFTHSTNHPINHSINRVSAKSSGFEDVAHLSPSSQFF